MKNKLAIVTGRFGHFTIGHEYLAGQAIRNSELVMILVGSAQEKGTFRNPFSVETRMKVLQKIYPPESTNVIVGSLPDMTDENDIRPEWGRFFLEHVNLNREQFNIEQHMDVMYYGHDEDRHAWFDASDIAGVEMVPVQRGVVDISATKMRMFLARNEKEKWVQYANPRIHSMFEELREELISVLEYKQIAQASDRTNIEVLFENNMADGRIRNSIFQKNLPDGVKWVYSHNNWCNGAGVAVLPYRVKSDGSFEYLGRMERCPAHSDDTELGVVMGGYDKQDKLSMAGHAAMELEEEAGYRTHESNLISLGTVRPEKSSDTTHYLYAINVEHECVEKVEAIGDGTIIEMDAYTEWVNETTAVFCKASVFSTMIQRLKYHLGTSK